VWKKAQSFTVNMSIYIITTTV